MEKNCPQEWFNKIKATMDNGVVQQFPEKKTPSCTLSFKSQHVKSYNSCKIKSPYLNVRVICTFPSCSAKYQFTRKKEPVRDNLVKIFVKQKGKITHKTGETKFRPATKTKRGKIARALRKGVSKKITENLRRHHTQK